LNSLEPTPRYSLRSYLPRSCSVSILIDETSGPNDDQLHLSQPTHLRSPQFSSSQSIAVVRGAVLSDITSVVNAGPVALWKSRIRAKSAREYERKKSFYRLVCAQLAHADDNTMCAHCGIREHSALHHEDGFKRDGTGVSARRTHRTHLCYCSLRLLCLTTTISSAHGQCADPCTLRDDPRPTRGGGGEVYKRGRNHRPCCSVWCVPPGSRTQEAVRMPCACAEAQSEEHQARQGSQVRTW
jgi:hypothetical protein